MELVTNKRSQKDGSILGDDIVSGDGEGIPSKERNMSKGNGDC